MFEKKIQQKSSQKLPQKSPQKLPQKSPQKLPQKSPWFEKTEPGLKPPSEMNKPKYEKIILAAGCFWGIEARLRKIKGVVDTKVGYIGGKTIRPTYKQVCYENTEHVEACAVAFNNDQINLVELLNVFWSIHNPTEIDRQGADVGRQYRSAIFFANEMQQAIAIQSREHAQKQFAAPITTEITQATRFWNAEEYHQRYLDKKRGIK